MPQERSQYRLPREMRKQEQDKPLPDSDKKTLDPKYLLEHQNHFDPNVYTPEQMIQKGILKSGGIKPLIKT